MLARHSWQRQLAAAVCVACLVATLGPAGAEELAVGVGVGERIAVGDKTIPLPAGQWIVAGLGDDHVQGRKAGALATVREVVLFKLRGDNVEAFAFVHANSERTAGGWGLSRDCRREDIHFARIYTEPRSAFAFCAFVNHVLQRVDGGSAAAWTAANLLASERGWRLPATWLMAGFRAADDEDVVDARYHFNADLLGLDYARAEPTAAPRSEGWFGGLAHRLRGAIAGVFGRPPDDPPAHSRWADSPWGPTGVAGDAMRRAAVARIVAWVETAGPEVRAGFKNRTTARVPVPEPWARGGAQGAAPGHLDVASGAGAAAGPGAEGQQTGDVAPWSQAAWKTLSWRAIGSGLDAVISYLFTGSVAVSGAITVVGGIANATAYYFHEIAWSVFGVDAGPGAAQIEFVGAGVDR